MAFPSSRLPAVANPVAEFLEGHQLMTAENAQLKEDKASLLMQNSSLLAEVQMLREELGRTDRDRTRLQGFASNLVTRLDVISETIGIAVSEAAAFRIEPSREPAKAKPAEQRQAEQKTDDGLREMVARFPVSDRLPKVTI